MIYATVQVNCASMAQANEVMHQIKRFLPVQKFIQIFPFESFMEIPPLYFDGYYNNPDSHDIDNLFLRYNGTTGEKTYYYKVHYKPMVQLNSVSSDFSDNSARSYPVTCDFSYLIQSPIWLFDTYNEEHIQRVNLGFQLSDNISSVIVDNKFLSTTNTSFEYNGIYYESREQYIIDQTSENFRNKRIIIPNPIAFANDRSNLVDGGEKINNEFIITVAKLSPRKSTVVSYIGTNSPIFRDSLNTYYLEEQRDYVKGKDTITIFVEGKDYLTPDLSSPIIITILEPKSDKETKTTQNKANFLSKKSKVFEIKNPTKQWLKM